MLPASLILVLQSWRYPEGFLCINAWGRVTVISLETKHVRDLSFVRRVRNVVSRNYGSSYAELLRRWAVYSECIEFHVWWVQLYESQVKWKHYWFDNLSNRVKKKQLDAQLILSIFPQPLHVSGVSRPIIRRYNTYGLRPDDGPRYARNM